MGQHEDERAGERLYWPARWITPEELAQLYPAPSPTLPDDDDEDA